MPLQRRIQRLRSKLGYVRHGVSHRVSTTISSLRDRSYAYAGFQTSKQHWEGESSDPSDWQPLRSTIVRALLVDEVTYEPSSRLKKSRKAVVLITGADLVLVKMTSMTKANNSGSSSSGSGTAGNPDAAAVGSASGGVSTAAAAAAAGASIGSGAGGRTSVDAAAAVAADARASVLAQHELNKMVRCQVSGNRLDLEFIVTGGAEFKVSAAALGLNAASSSSSSSSSTPQSASGAAGGAGGYSASSSMTRTVSRLDEEEEDADVAAEAGAEEHAGEHSGVGTGASSSGDSRAGARLRLRDMRSKSESALPFSRAGGASRVNSMETGSSEASAAAGAGAGASSNGQQAPSAAAAARTASDGVLAGIDVAATDFAAEDCLGSSSADRTGGVVDAAAAPAAAISYSSSKLGRWITRYSNSSNNSISAVVGSPPVAGGSMFAGSSSGAGAAGAPASRSSFVRGFGARSLSSLSAAAAGVEDGSRSSFRPVKTDDGEYLVWVEAFSLTFSNSSLAEMAADLLRTGRSTMRQALDWLKQGLPFSPEFSVTHITQLNSRTGADELLQAGPTPWGTILQLPDSWVEAVRSASLPEEQPLYTALEVPEGPAAFKVCLSTPAGLAEATLLPELIAVLSQQPCTHGQVLAVPVVLSLPAAADEAEEQQQQQEEEVAHQEQRLREQRDLRQPGSSVGVFSTAHSHDTTQVVGEVHEQGVVQQRDQHQQQESQSKRLSDGDSLFASAQSRGGLASMRSGSQKGLTWADQQPPQQQQHGSGTAEPLPAYSDAQQLVRSSSSGNLPAGFAAAAAGGGGSSSPGRTSLTVQHSQSTPHLAGLERLLSDTADEVVVDQQGSSNTASATEGGAARAAEQQGTQRRYVQSGSAFAAAGSNAGDGEQPAAAPGSAVGGAAGDAPAAGTSTATSAAAANTATSSNADSHATGSSSTDEHRSPAPFGSLSTMQRQSSATQLSFAAEVHAILHVQLLLDLDDSSSSSAAALMLPPGAKAGHGATAAAAGGAHTSPFVLQAASVGLDDSSCAPALFPCGSMELQHSITQAPSILRLGPAQSSQRPSARQQQALQGAAALVAALLCGVAVLLRQTDAAALLVLCAVAVNALGLAVALNPSCFRGASRALRRLGQVWRRRSTAHGHAHHHHHHRHSGQHHHKGQHSGLKRQHSKGTGGSSGGHSQQHSGSAAGAGAAEAGKGDSSAAVGSISHQHRNLRGLRLQLLGGSFVKEALGLLEQQINAYRHLQELQETCSASFVSESDSGIDSEGSGSEDEEAQAMWEAVFVSSPEPAWLNRDWRRRLWNARPTQEERCRLAGVVHAWRESVGADTLLQQLPPHFDWFQKHLVLRPLLKTPQGHLVVLLKLHTLSSMHRLLAAANLTPTCLMHYCGFMWAWMFEEHVRAEWPQGRFVLLADMSGLKLGQAVGEGQVGGRALGEVCNAYPERLMRCLVLGAPNWFNMLYRLIRPQLSPSTRAKVQVCTNQAEAVAELSACLGSEWVPAEYGGPCSQPYDGYPGQKALLAHVAKLRQQAS